MCFLGLEDAEYTNGPDGHGSVISSVLLKFPEMDGFRFSGNLTLSGKGYTSKEATEDAAFEALVFIENVFGVKVADFNYSKRSKARNQLNKLVAMLSEILGIAETLRMMWAKLNNAIDGGVALFRFDPSSLFSGTQLFLEIVCDTCSSILLVVFSSICYIQN